MPYPLAGHIFAFGIRRSSCAPRPADRSLAPRSSPASSLLAPTSSPADPVAVAHPEGLAHGFLALHSLEGTAARRRRPDPDLERRSRDDASPLPLQGRLDARRDHRLHAAKELSPRERSRGAEGSGVQDADGVDHQCQRRGHGPLHRGRQGEGDRGSPRAARRPRERPDPHPAQEHLPEDAEDDGVDARDHAEAAAGEAGVHPRRRGALLDRGVRAQGHALRGEGARPRHRRRDRLGAPQGPAGLARLDPGRRGAGVREGRDAALPGRPAVADRAGEPDLAIRIEARPRRRAPSTRRIPRAARIDRALQAPGATSGPSR